MFAETGLSPAQISTLLVLWSAASFLLEIPSGLVADLFSRRRLLVLSPLVTGLGYALWTFLPSYPAFAAGFVLWGAGGALASGAQEALLYEELARLGAASSYPRVFGRVRALGTVAVVLASLAAAPVMAAGGFHALGVASTAVPLLTAAVAWTLPEHRSAGESSGDGGDEEPGLRAVLREGAARLRTVPVIRRLLLAVVLMSGFSAMDEFLPLLASEASGAALSLVPLLVLLPSIGDAAGGWFAGRGGFRPPAFLALAALLLAAGAALRHPLGFVPIGAAFGLAQWTLVNAEARLQHSLSDRSRATVTSLAGIGMEVLAVLVYAAYGLGSLWSPSWLLFVLAALPQLLLALALRVRRGRDGR